MTTIKLAQFCATFSYSFKKLKRLTDNLKHLVGGLSKFIIINLICAFVGIGTTLAMSPPPLEPSPEPFMPQVDPVPGTPDLSIDFSQQRIQLSWQATEHAEYYPVYAYTGDQWQHIENVSSTRATYDYKQRGWDMSQLQLKILACKAKPEWLLFAWWEGDRCSDYSNSVLLPLVNPIFSLSSYSLSLSTLLPAKADSADSQTLSANTMGAVRAIPATLRLRDTVSWEYQDILWPISLDSNNFTVTSNKTLVVKPGNYHIEFLATQGNVQYAAKAMNVDLNDSQSNIALELKTVFSDSAVTIDALGDLSEFGFQSSLALLADLSQPKIGVKINNNYETLLTFNPEIGITQQYHLISGGRHNIRLKVHDSVMLMGRSKPQQEDRVIVAGQDLDMALVPLVGGISTTLADGKAILNLSIPSMVIDEVGGDPNNLQVVLKLSGINNQPEDVIVDNLIYNTSADAYEARYTYSGLEADTQVAVSMTFTDTSGVVNERLGRCVANGLILDSATHNAPCQLTVRRRAIIGNHLLSELDVHVLDGQHLSVKGAHIYIYRQDAKSSHVQGSHVQGSHVQNSLGTFVGLTGSGFFGDQGHFKTYLLPDNYVVTAQYLPLDASAQVDVELSASETLEEDIILDGLDTVRPEINLIGAAEVWLYQGDFYEDAGATASDNVDGDITSSIEVHNPVDTDIEGEYRITYTVSDQAGNLASVTRTVYVVAKPEIVVTPNSLTFKEGASDNFSVHLSAEPLSDMVLSIDSNDRNAATVDTEKLIFTPDNWRQQQPVNVTGVLDNDVMDESVTVTVSVDQDQTRDDLDNVADQTVAVIIEDITVNGGWSVWSNWDSCSKTCGEGTQTRTRVCNNPSPAHGGAQCSGDDTDSQSCNTQPCPRDGGWSGWSNWGSCSKTCGGGTQTRTRVCNNPSPAHGGAQCSGDDTDSQSCNTQPCPRDGGWSKWGPWSQCSPECTDSGWGEKTRSRTCNNPSPAYGGAQCSGPSTGSESCETKRYDEGPWTTSDGRSPLEALENCKPPEMVILVNQCGSKRKLICHKPESSCPNPGQWIYKGCTRGNGVSYNSYKNNCGETKRESFACNSATVGMYCCTARDR